MTQGPPFPVIHLLASLDRGGLERVVVDIVTHLDRQRFSPQVCTLTGGGVLGAEVRAQGIPLLEFDGCSSALDWRVIRQLRRHFREHQIAVIHTHNRGPNLYGAVAGRLAHVPVIIHTRHGINRPRDRKAVLVNRVAGALAHQLTAVSEHARQIAIKFERTNPNKIVTVHNGIDLARFADRSRRETVRRALGFGPEITLVGHVGRLTEAKDHLTLLRGFQIIQAALPQTRLILVGDGERRAPITEQIKTLKLADIVTLLGDRADVPDLLSAIDLLVLPSVTEGISITLLEAMAAGLPVVATAVGGNPEVVADGVTGILCPPQSPPEFAEAVIQLLKNPALCQQFGVAGRSRALSEFSVNQMVTCYQNMYDTLLHAKGLPIAGTRGVNDHVAMAAGK